MAEQWDIAGLTAAIERDFEQKLDVPGWLAADASLEEEGLRKRIVDELNAAYEQKVQQYGAPVMRHVEKALMLQQLDAHWREHLAAMDYMRQGIHLRGYAQKNPKQEYKREAFELFSSMLERIKLDTITALAKVQVRTQEDIDREERMRQERLARALQAQHAQAQALLGGGDAEEEQGGTQQQRQHTPVRVAQKVGRNEPCPCGSGKKFKHCHGALE
jgi:preprotein translocase subunit SecA